MKISFPEFDSEKFSFQDHPVLVLEDFWTEDEVRYFREGMNRATWTPLVDLPQALRTFRNCGNWLEAELHEPQRTAFLQKIGLSFVLNYVNSFANIKRLHMGFNYYSYGVGDCLSIHDDQEGYAESGKERRVYRRVALVTYLHSEWQHNWGGELIVYERKQDGTQSEALELSLCIPPYPRSLVLFTVPRLHRVCRVDPLAGDHRRLSLAGWFSTEH